MKILHAEVAEAICNLPVSVYSKWCFLACISGHCNSEYRFLKKSSSSYQVEHSTRAVIKHADLKGQFNRLRK